VSVDGRVKQNGGTNKGGYDVSLQGYQHLTVCMIQACSNHRQKPARRP